jgi:hypothetical protein
MLGNHSNHAMIEDTPSSFEGLIYQEVCRPILAASRYCVIASLVLIGHCRHVDLQRHHPVKRVANFFLKLSHKRNRRRSPPDKANHVQERYYYYYYC